MRNLFDLKIGITAGVLRLGIAQGGYVAYVEVGVSLVGFLYFVACDGVRLYRCNVGSLPKTLYNYCTMRHLALAGTLVVLLFFSSCSFLYAQQTSCHDAAGDSHYSVVLENSRVRVLRLELGRLKQTDTVCMKKPYLSIVTSESRTASVVQGGATYSHDWNPGEARFHYKVVAMSVRNETSLTHHEVLIETYLPVQFNPLDGDYDTDEFGSDLSTVKPTWSTSFTRGALTATRVQLAPGDRFQLYGTDYILIALNDLVLADDSAKKITSNRHDVSVLKSGIQLLANEGTEPARFVLVQF